MGFEFKFSLRNGFERLGFYPDEAPEPSRPVRRDDTSSVSRDVMPSRGPTIDAHVKDVPPSVQPEIFYGRANDPTYRGEWKSNGDVVVSSSSGDRRVVGNTTDRNEASNLANDHYLGE
jgi:hypothetical protein